MLVVGGGLGAILFPQRADLVGAVGETTGHLAFRRMRDRMRRDAVGADILRRRPRVTDDTLERAWGCADGTFGKAYATFMGTRKFRASDRPPVRFVDDEELAYVATRARETHDLWHVLFGCPTTVQGELALKALEFAQTGMPSAALATLAAPLRLDEEDRAFLAKELYPWAWRAGGRCADLMCADYEAEFDTDLEELRAKWRITPAPKAPKRKPRKTYP
uniref:Ubiquinone biosynthesis protein COQ4 homolog, mitochondrial n=1 Tax=Micromonas pusilla TaxID=38833 RepID=A0A7R9XTQ2_MICPS